jgi:hypothetical protein
MRYRMFAVTLSTATSLLLFHLLVPVRTLGVTPLTALGMGMGMGGGMGGGGGMGVGSWMSGILSMSSIHLPILATTSHLMCLFYLGPIATLMHYLYLAYGHDISPSGVLHPLSPQQQLKRSVGGYMWDVWNSGVVAGLQR